MHRLWHGHGPDSSKGFSRNVLEDAKRELGKSPSRPEAIQKARDLTRQGHILVDHHQVYGGGASGGYHA
jgi:hypothetical protein